MDLLSRKKPQSPEDKALTQDIAPDERALYDTPLSVQRPVQAKLPFVFSSPHSGRVYPASFVKSSNLDPVTLRRSEDCFVEEIFGGVVALGAPLIHAHFPRAYLDANREPYELDPAMFADPLPPHVNTRSLRVAGGLGTIARVVADATEIYREPMAYAEADRRIRLLYMPFHDALRDLLEETHKQFGGALLIDCHSMPSTGEPGDDDTGAVRPDIVLGDRYGTSCASEITQAAERILKRLGYNTTRNNPYAGGFNTEHYGRPARGLHALQIEINRGLYMDEARLQRGPGLKRLKSDMASFVAEMGTLDIVSLTGATRGAAF
ncbi:MAG: N-formylglutamate amidohydrolase [Parvibaculaceae bacterium]